MVAPNVTIAPPPVQRFCDSNGNALSGGKLFTYIAGSTTKLATYTDSTAATANTNPIVLNSRGEPPSQGIWLISGLAYKFVLSPSTDTDPPTNAIWTEDNILATQPFSYWGGTSTGAANAYAIAQPEITAYAAPFEVTFIASFANTGAATISVNGLGTKNIFKATSSGPAALSGGEIQTNQIVTLIYDGTQFQITSQGSPNAYLAGGGTGTYTPSGALNKQSSVAGIGNGADTTEDTLFTYSLPASTLNTNGQIIRITVWGQFGGTGDTKIAKIYFGSTVLTSISTATSNVNWRLSAEVSRNGASTQTGTALAFFSNTFNGVGQTTPNQTDTNAIVIKATGQDTSTATAGEIKGFGFLVEFIP